jgi:hypothetical protein
MFALYIYKSFFLLINMVYIMIRKFLYNVWRSSSEIRESVAAKRTELDQLRLRLKLYSVLNEQVINFPEPLLFTN